MIQAYHGLANSGFTFASASAPGKSRKAQDSLTNNNGTTNFGVFPILSQTGSIRVAYSCRPCPRAAVFSFVFGYPDAPVLASVAVCTVAVYGLRLS